MILGYLNAKKICLTWRLWTGPVQGFVALCARVVFGGSIVMAPPRVALGTNAHFASATHRHWLWLRSRIHMLGPLNLTFKDWYKVCILKATN